MSEFAEKLKRALVDGLPDLASQVGVDPMVINENGVSFTASHPLPAIRKKPPKDYFEKKLKPLMGGPKVPARVTKAQIDSERGVAR